MFLHLGNDVVIPLKEVIAIIDLHKDEKKLSEINQEFLQVAEEEGFIELVGEENKIKSFIITNKKIYLSPISSATLRKRSGYSPG
ncbi:MULTISPECIES: extracellular matrix regulator RemB [Carboxydocella]|uniref:DUF370 domain-containing protein n=2 Tax=Carboxydocella TaxID=178898 RepID=A0A1T4SBE5_9FIRM|nr:MULTISPECIES: extracellular matrix/biofilm biosynthesis regulator RemA family protein [Carboxydocella]AVX19223.1 protein of unknown function (DUF370) [Carboxydocella thermautotrophica]AVX29636.1 protein of unknown function (DUF370) [Carboxydocella thermautotrophica]SKA25532.1 protein of unknown function [Carboxydocella sporoproducens DSM 16521]GAW30212.1 DUF370 domain-containing protein [Carboxydocella sp. ULO1]GAW32248.1 DUF370 domain-containing protein [Carboxydocella sp. JDF658]